MPSIETARLRLRPFAMSDLDDYYTAILADARVMEHLPGGKPLPRERAASMLRGIIDQWAEAGYGLWALRDKATDDFVGYAGLQPLDNRDDVELAFAIARAYWRRGMAAEAGEAVLRYGFETLGLPQIVATCAPENRAAQRVLQKIGLKFERRMRVYNDILPFYALQAGRYQPDPDATYIVTTDTDS